MNEETIIAQPDLVRIITNSSNIFIKVEKDIDSPNGSLPCYGGPHYVFRRLEKGSQTFDLLVGVFNDLTSAIECQSAQIEAGLEKHWDTTVGCYV